ncbi:hypothetical protein CsatB_004072 [Cannabis sativa]
MEADIQSLYDEIVSLPPITINESIVDLVNDSFLFKWVNSHIGLKWLTCLRCWLKTMIGAKYYSRGRWGFAIVEAFGGVLFISLELWPPQCFLVPNERERVRSVVSEVGTLVIMQVLLGDSPMRVQARVARLVAMMAKQDRVTQNTFATENVNRSLATLLSFDTVSGHNRSRNHRKERGMRSVS